MAKRFKWRFESVKKAKEREEEQGQQNLVRAQDALTSEEAKLAELRDQREVYIRQLREKQDGRLNTADLSRINTYLENLAGQIKAQAQQVEKTRSVVNRHREALLKTVQERKVLENLKERDYRAFRKTERRQDQVTMDETANRRNGHRGL